MTYMFILKCALKLVEEIILYYDARSKKHQIFKDVIGKRYRTILIVSISGIKEQFSAYI